MQEFREGEEGQRPLPSTPQENDSSTSTRFEDIGDLHRHAAAYSSAAEYYRSALRAMLSNGKPRPHLSAIHRKLAECLAQQGYLEEALEEIQSARASLTSDAPLDPAVLDLAEAFVRLRQGEYEFAQRLASSAFGSLAVTDLHREVGDAQKILGSCSFRLGAPDKAEELFQDALSTYRRIEDASGQAMVLNNLGLLAKNACRWSRALQFFQRAETIVVREGHTGQQALVLNNMAVLYRKMGRRAEAMATVERGLKMSRNLGDQVLTIRFKLLMGQLQIEDRRLDDAQRNLLEAKVLAERVGAQRDIALADEFLGDLMAAELRWPEAELNYRAAEQRAKSLGSCTDILAELLRRTAAASLAQGAFDEALDRAARGLSVARECGELFEIPYLHRVQGLAHRAGGRREDARLALELSLAGFRKYRLYDEVVRGYLDLAELHLELGETKHLLVARNHLREAVKISAADGDQSPCELQLRLARVELVLGNFDDALLALFEIERLSCCGEGGLDPDVQSLRAEIEAAVESEAKDTSSRYQVLADLPDRLSIADENLTQNLRSLVTGVAERLRADRACLAILEADGKLRVLTTLRLHRSRAKRLVDHALGLLQAEAKADGPRVWTRPQADPAWTATLGEEMECIGSALALPIHHGDEMRGLLYLDRAAGGDQNLCFNNEALGAATSYVKALEEFILDAVVVPKGASGASSLIREEAFENILTKSDAMVEVLSLCAKVANSSYTVLFTGETGTGKGLIAYALHSLSPRRDRRFLSVNCAAIPETLLESELFGHVRGAFTGADRDRLGLIREAHGGTLFLDEVGKMSLPMQAKLLHFLDSFEVRPVGGATSHKVDVRVLCASKRDLRRLVSEDLFLEDLYYRLLDFPIEVPPLRDRPDDILLLARHYIERTATELGRAVPQMTRAFASRLRTHAWPGNVRELEKIIKRTVVIAGPDERLRLSHLPSELSQGQVEDDDELADELRPLKEQLSEMERALVKRALDRCGWNRSEAARKLKISYPTLLQKIKIYNLTVG